MNKNIKLIAGILAGLNLIYSFVGNAETQAIFGFEISIWLYRLIWGFLTAVLLYDHFNTKKKEQKG